MHDKARAALRSRLTEALHSAQLGDGKLEAWRDGFDGVRDQILKYRGDWLERYDVNGVIEQIMGRHLPKSAQKQTGPISKWVTEELISNTAKELLAFFESVPRPYQILFPLPRVAISREIKLSDTITLIRTPDEKNSLVGAANGKKWISKPRPNTTYLSVQAHGFVSSNLNQSAMRDALGLMKRVLQVGVVKDVFEKDWSTNQGQVLAEILGSPLERIHQAVVYDLLDKEKPPELIRLRLGTSSYLDSIRIYDDTVPRRLKTPVISSKNRDADLENLIAFPVFLMTAPEAEENTKSLRSALEWAFDSDADDEPTTGFIKTCIALEAALGEESEGDQITERLADRCAFLLNKTSVERARTRRVIKDSSGSARLDRKSAFVKC